MAYLTDFLVEVISNLLERNSSPFPILFPFQVTTQGMVDMPGGKLKWQITDLYKKAALAVQARLFYPSEFCPADNRALSINMYICQKFQTMQQAKKMLQMHKVSRNQGQDFRALML